MVQALGAVVGLMPGGVLADTHDRKTLRTWSAAGTLVLGVIIVGLLAAGAMTPVLLACLGFLSQARASLLGPASEALVRTVVHRDQVAQAVANNQGRDAAVSIISGPAGRFLLALGPAMPFVAESVGTIVTLVSNLGIPGRHRPERPDDNTSMWADLVSGVRFVLGAPLLRQGCLVFMVANLATAAALTALIMRLQLDGESSVTIGLVTLVIGVAALVGAVAAGPLVQRVRTGVLVVGVLIGLGVGLIGIALAPHYTWALVALGGAILLAPAANAALGGLLMHVVPNQQLGRLNAFIMFLATCMTPLAPALAGWGIDLIGYPATQAGFAGLAVVAGALALATRTLRSLPRPKQWHTVEL